MIIDDCWSSRKRDENGLLVPDPDRFPHGIDYLKYDNCFRPSSVSTEILYRRMSMALRCSGRDILFAACQWGKDNMQSWIRYSGEHTFRSTIDIQDSWSSVEQIVRSRLENRHSHTQGCVNDMDILVVGMNGGGFNPETSMGGCTYIEYRMHLCL